MAQDRSQHWGWRRGISPVSTDLASFRSRGEVGLADPGRLAVGVVFAGHAGMSGVVL
jgi:hypothetical protein